MELCCGHRGPWSIKKARNHLTTSPTFSLNTFSAGNHLLAEMASSSQFSHEFTEASLLTPLTLGRIGHCPGNHWLDSSPFYCNYAEKG